MKEKMRELLLKQLVEHNHLLRPNHLVAKGLQVLLLLQLTPENLLVYWVYSDVVKDELIILLG